MTRNINEIGWRELSILSIVALLPLAISYPTGNVVEFVASRVCAQAPLDATPRPGALSGTDPKANFWTLLRGLAPITVRSANPLCYLPSFVLLFCHVPFPYSYYTLDSSMPHPNGHASPLSLSRAAYYNSKHDSLWYLTIGLIITSTRHVAQ
jgi:hypothetical protein